LAKKNKLNDLKKEMSETLAVQVEAKKKQISNEKHDDKLIGSKLTDEVEKIRLEKANQMSKLEEERTNYRKDLDQQLTMKILKKREKQENPYHQKKVLRNKLNEYECEEENM